MISLTAITNGTENQSGNNCVVFPSSSRQIPLKEIKLATAAYFHIHQFSAVTQAFDAIWPKLLTA